ncbi:MAG: VOC family protein [Magnetococcales bacterium]|nr:VOC family protein [Magnetococcales bacterium]
MNYFTGIHHTAFATNNIEKTVHFWRDLLGMRLVYAYGRTGYRQYFFEVSGNNRISFFEWPEVSKVDYRRHGDPVKGPFIFDHIAIGVEKVDQLWEIMARLDAADFPVSDVIDHGCFFSIYSYDPNGIPIEFSCDSVNMNTCLEQNPVMKDDAPHPKELEASFPRPGVWPKPEKIPEEDRILVPGEGREHFPKNSFEIEELGHSCIDQS